MSKKGSGNKSAPGQDTKSPSATDNTSSEQRKADSRCCPENVWNV